MPQKYHHPNRDFYVKHKVAPPTVETHGTEEDIRERLKPVVCSGWRQEGNQLIADTELGRLVQLLPTDMMLVGVDNKNLPILKKVIV